MHRHAAGRSLQCRGDAIGGRVFRVKASVNSMVNGTRWGPSSLAKLVQITPISLWFMADITIVFMGFINQLITGGHHPVDISSGND